MKPYLHRTEIKKASVEDQHETACAFGENRFALKGECLPMWVLNTGEHLIWIESKWEDDAEKIAHVRAITAMIKLLDCVAYSMLTEAWVAVEHAGPDGAFAKKHVLPSDRPKNERDDILLVLTSGRDGSSYNTRYLVTQRRTGPNFLGPRIDQHELKFAGGEMMNLFEKAGMT